MLSVRDGPKNAHVVDRIDIIEKHSVIDVSDSTIFTTKNEENVELLIFTPYGKV